MKKNPYIILIFLCTCGITFTFAQQNYYKSGSPDWLVDMFFKQTQFPNKENYLSGEMLKDAKNPTIGEELNGGANVTIKQFEAVNGKSVYGINIGGNRNSANFYCFLSNISGSWKIEAIRKFQVPAFIYDAVDSLSRIKNLPDSVASLLKSLELVVGSDEELQNYLAENINDFYNLVGAFQNKATERLNELMSRLALDYIFTDKNYPNCIFVSIAQFGRQEAGFIYSTNKAGLPQISPERFIYIDNVLPNWYVFRAM